MPVDLETIDPFDRAISRCDEHIESLHVSLRFIVRKIYLAIVVMLGILIFFLWYLRAEKEEQVFIVIIFAILAVFAIVFGVLMSMYRFQLNEISKTEYYRIGFMRVRIAAYGTFDGYQSEVRRVLTDRAFTAPARQTLGSRGAIESPLPGHPGSDAFTVLFNRLLDHFEIRDAKKPPKGSK